MCLAISILACIQIRVIEKKGARKIFKLPFSLFSFSEINESSAYFSSHSKARLDVIKLFILFEDSIEGEKDDEETAKQDKYAKLHHGNGRKISLTSQIGG